MDDNTILPFAYGEVVCIGEDRVERLLDTLFELLDSIATDYTAIFECLSPERPTDHRGSGRCAQGSTEARQPPRD